MRTSAVEAKLRRSPKYGVFMGLGAILGALAGWIATASVPPVEGQDTTPVIGLMVVVGFVAGGMLGAIAALAAARIVDKRDVTVRAEHTVVEHPSERDDGAATDAEADGLAADPDSPQQR